jgi:hypothetical protein
MGGISYHNLTRVLAQSPSPRRVATPNKRARAERIAIDPEDQARLLRMRQRKADLQQEQEAAGDDDVCIVDEQPLNVEDPVCSDGEQVNFKVRNEQGHEKGYRYATNRLFRKLHQAYCREHGLEPAKLNLYFDGDKVDLDTATPASLEIEDEDVMDAVVKK